MTIFLRTHARRYDWRTAVFRIVAASAAFGLLLGDGIGIIAPWLGRASYHISALQEPLQRWYAAQRGTYAGILLIGSLLALLWRPQAQPLLLQFLILAGTALALSGAPFDPFASGALFVAIALLALAYPNRAALASFSRPGRLSWPLLALSLPTAALLAIQAALAASQRYDRGAAAAVALAITLALAGLLAATKRPGWQILGLLAGAALIYLGLAAARMPGLAGSWGAVGVALATLGGWTFVGATAWELHRDTRRAQQN